MEYFVQSLENYHLSSFQWGLAIIAAIILGMTKAGINSLSIITVTILAHVFGSKVSTGVLLPMLISADIVAVWYYKKHAQWAHLLRLLPWMVAGVLLGWWIGKDINEVVFKRTMAGIILFSITMLLWFERKKSLEVPSHWLFASSLGLGAGFTTMVGNLAGGLSNVYFLSMQLSKQHFIGTAAWLFFIINLFKLPFHIFSWKTVSVHSLAINIVLLPFLMCGFFIGKRIVYLLTDSFFRKIIIALTIGSVLIVLLGL